MSRSVVVLCPNGRRKTFKFNQTSTVNQILEDFCKKEKYEFTLFDFKNQRTILDRTLQWRFTNLPNNAKLELVKRTITNEDVEVRIAVQLADGKRLNASFKTSTTLKEILLHFGNEIESEIDGNPVFVYLRQEFIGDEVLSKTNLSSIGIIKGSALMRFFYKPIPCENKIKTPEILSTSTLEQQTINKSQKEQLKEINSTTFIKNMNSQTSSSTNQTAEVKVDNKTNEDKQKEDNLITEQSLKSELPPNVASKRLKVDENSKIMGNTVPVNSTNQSKELFLTNQKSENLTNQEPERLTNQEPESSTNQEPENLTNQKPQTLTNQEPEMLTNQDLEQPTNQEQEMSTNQEPEQPTNQEQEMSTNHEPEMSTNQEPEMSTNEKPTSSSIFQQDPLLFYENISPRNSEGDSIPDEFFEVTLDDVRKMMADLKHDRQRLEEKEMMTENVRKQRREKLMNKYPKVIVRFVFGSRHILQGNFLTHQKLDELYKFVEDQTGISSFYLFTTPPKMILKNKDSILFDNKIVRASRIYVGGTENNIGSILQDIIDNKQ